MLKRVLALLAVLCLLPVCALGDTDEQLQKMTELVVRAAVMSNTSTLDKTMPEAFAQALLSLLDQQGLCGQDEAENASLLFSLAAMAQEGSCLPGMSPAQSTEILVATDQTSVRNGAATVWANVYDMTPDTAGEEAMPVGRAQLEFSQAEDSQFGWRLTAFTLADWVEHSEMNMVLLEKEDLPYSLQYPDVFDLEELTVNGTTFLAENTDGVCVSVQVAAGAAPLAQLAEGLPNVRVEEDHQYLTARETDEGWVTFTMIIVVENEEYILKYVYPESMTELALYEALIENAFTAAALSVG